MIEQLKNNPSGNFFLLAGPCVIEGEDMAMRIAEKVVNITETLKIPYVFKGSYRKANRSRLDSFMGIGDEKALKILKKVHAEYPPLQIFTRLRKQQWLLNMRMYSKSLHFFVDKQIFWLRLLKQEKW